VLCIGMLRQRMRARMRGKHGARLLGIAMHLHGQRFQAIKLFFIA